MACRGTALLLFYFNTYHWWYVYNSLRNPVLNNCSLEQIQFLSFVYSPVYRYHFIIYLVKIDNISPILRKK
jgi:hypothetical protein